jgi:prepilin peptidase CpaA
MALALPSDAAFWLLLGALPIAVWVVWTDLATMKIPNKAVLALMAVFAVAGVATLPLTVWAWAWAQFAVVLVAGFLLSLTGGFGAGDAKFAAAMAPFVALGDLGLFMLLLSAMAIVSFVLHRIARQLPAVRAAAPGWASWERREFPFGIALAPSLIVYLGLAATLGS